MREVVLGHVLADVDARLSPGMVGTPPHARHTTKVYEDAVQFCVSLQSTSAAPGGDTWVLAWDDDMAVQSCTVAGQSALVALSDGRLSKALQVKRPAEARMHTWMDEAGHEARTHVMYC